MFIVDSMNIITGSVQVIYLCEIFIRELWNGNGLRHYGNLQEGSLRRFIKFNT